MRQEIVELLPERFRPRCPVVKLVREDCVETLRLVSQVSGQGVPQLAERLGWPFERVERRLYGLPHDFDIEDLTALAWALQAEAKVIELSQYRNSIS